MVNTINTCLRLEIRVMRRNFILKSVLIEFVIQNKSLSYFCISEIFSTSVTNHLFNYKITFKIYELVVNSQRLLCCKKRYPCSLVYKYNYLLKLNTMRSHFQLIYHYNLYFNLLKSKRNNHF